MKLSPRLGLTITASLVLSGSVIANDVTRHIATIQAIGSEGSGNREAAAAWESLSKAETTDIVTILAAMDKAGPLAANYLRGAIGAISDRASSENKPLPLVELGDFLLDTSHNPRARRLAFDLISTADAATADTLIPGLLMDPSPELRREAVARLMTEASALRESKNLAAAAIVYRQALHGARDIAQIKDIAKALGELGSDVDLPRHFGFLMHWNVVGPFDNTDRKGFDAVFPPESGVDLGDEYESSAGKAKWLEFVTADEFGMVDINKAYGMEKQVTAYAFTEFNSVTARPAELRLGCKNAWKIWLNGELVFGRDEYHRGMAIDQYKLPVSLKEGKNTLLVKVCQNEQTETWTVQWQFQLRVCDSTGTAILATDRPPTPTEGTDLQQKNRRRKPQGSNN